MGAEYLNRWIASNSNQVLLIESGRATSFSDTTDSGGVRRHQIAPPHCIRGSRGGKGEGINGAVPRWARSGCWIAAPWLAGGEVEDGPPGRSEGQREREAASQVQPPAAKGNYESRAGCTERVQGVKTMCEN
jgi:hypothetical protein